MNTYFQSTWKVNMSFIALNQNLYVRWSGDFLEGAKESSMFRTMFAYFAYEDPPPSFFACFMSTPESPKRYKPSEKMFISPGRQLIEGFFTNPVYFTSYHLVHWWSSLLIIIVRLLLIYCIRSASVNTSG